MTTSYATVTPLRATERVVDSPPWWRRIDLALVSSAIVLALVGLLMIFSATRNLTQDGNYTGTD